MTLVEFKNATLDGAPCYVLPEAVTAVLGTSDDLETIIVVRGLQLYVKAPLMDVLTGLGVKIRYS